MNSRLTFTTLVLTALLLSACSNTDETEAEQGSINAMTQEIGHEAARMIKAPIDKAHTTVDQENNRIQELEKRLNQNE